MICMKGRQWPSWESPVQVASLADPRKSFIGMLDANGSVTGGSIMYEGVDISKYKTEKEWMAIRGKKISMAMQDPMTSLNPLKKIGKQIQESIELNQGIKGSCGKGQSY